MEPADRKDFDKEAEKWDESPTKVKLATEVAASIIREINPSHNMEVIDFGCGTGLVTLKLQPLVRRITGVDNSQGMLDILRKKVEAQGLGNVQIKFADFESGASVGETFNLIVSSMALHHVQNVNKLFKEWFSLLRPNGQVCFADLDTEDGSFHGENTGVFHLGFNRYELKQSLCDAGFCDVRDTTATSVIKKTDGPVPKQYPVFLITGARKH